MLTGRSLVEHLLSGNNVNILGQPVHLRLYMRDGARYGARVVSVTFGTDISILPTYNADQIGIDRGGDNIPRIILFGDGMSQDV